MKIYMKDNIITCDIETLDVLKTAKWVDVNGGKMLVFASPFDIRCDGNKVQLVSIGVLDFPSVQSIFRTVGVILDKEI